MIGAWIQAAEPLQSFWTVMAQESVFALVAFLAIWGICRLPCVRSPNLRLGLWYLVWLRFFLPVNFGLPISIFQIAEPLNAVWLPQSVPDAAGVQHMGEALKAGPAMVFPWALFLWLLTLAYVLGIAWRLWQFAKARRRLKKWISAAPEVNRPEVHQLLALWQKILGVNRRVRLLTGVHATVPFTAGWFQPVIYLPELILKQPVTVVESVLAHEMAHVKRMDDVSLMMLNLARMVFFFHPVASWLFRHCEAERERACDAMVLRQGPLGPASYGKSLLKVMQFPMAAAQSVPSLSVAAKTAAFRIKSLQDYPGARRRPFLAGLGLLALGCVLLPMADARAQLVPGNHDLAWLNPLPSGRTTSGYGMRRHPFSGEAVLHKGLDLSAPLGTWIQAPEDGVVLVASEHYEKGEAYGTVLVLRHGEAWVTLYSHLGRLAVTQGQVVKRGQHIATVGMTGQTTAPHLHFELWQNQEPVDPVTVIPLMPTP